MDVSPILPKPRHALGRGLSSLIPVAVPAQQDLSKLVQMSVEDLVPGNAQPRTNFDEGALAELAQSISEYGVIQPIIVRKRPSGQYEIVAGERRWRASKLAGLKTVPCVLSEVSSRDSLAVALVENIQREDLNVIEEAESYQRLSDELGMSQEQIAQAVGKDRSTVANALRLLKLPPETQKLVVDKRMSMGHARALLALRDTALIQQIADQIAEKGISVRQTEELVQQRRATKSKKSEALEARQTPEQRDIRRRLEHLFGTKVSLKEENGRGQISIYFSSTSELNGILEQLCL